MRYVRTRFNQQQRDWAYRFYIAECGRIIANNTANFGGGMALNTSLYDMIYPKPEKSGKELAQDFLSKLRGD